MATKVEDFKKRMKDERQQAIDTVKFYYFKDEFNRAYRVWQMGTPGDVFDVIPYQDIVPLLKFFERHPDKFIHGEPPDDDEVSSSG